MCLVPGLDFIVGNVNMSTDLLANHRAADDEAALLVLEVFKRYALVFGCLFQIVHTVRAHLFANLVQALDQFRIAGDAQLFAFVQQQLLVNEIAEHIGLGHGPAGLPFAGILLTNFILGGLGAVLQVGAGDDGIIHAGHDFIDDIVGAEKQRARRNHGSKQKYFLKHEYSLRNPGVTGLSAYFSSAERARALPAAGSASDRSFFFYFFFLPNKPPKTPPDRKSVV